MISASMEMVFWFIDDLSNLQIYVIYGSGSWTSNYQPWWWLIGSQLNYKDPKIQAGYEYIIYTIYLPTIVSYSTNHNKYKKTLTFSPPIHEISYHLKYVEFIWFIWYQIRRTGSPYQFSIMVKRK